MIYWSEWLCGVTILCEVLHQSLTACSSLQGASEDRLYWSIGCCHQKRASFLLEIDYCDSKFCSRWSDGVHEEWKPEILSRRRHISPGPVLRPHSTPSETCLCIIYWFRYAKSFSEPPMLWTLWSLLSLAWNYFNMESFPDVVSLCILGISAALLSVMGSRFKKSGKIFPAGVVSLVSLVMVGGYIHGILRSTHAWQTDSSRGNHYMQLPT